MHRLLKYIFIFCLINCSALKVSAQTANAFEKAGDKAYEKGDFYNAAFYYSQANDLNEGNLELVFKLANAYRESKDYRRASTYYSRVVVDDRTAKFPLASFYLGESKKHLGLYESAKSFFKQYIDRSKNSDAYFLRKANDELLFCDSAIGYTDYPVKVKVDNAGDNVNSEYSDFAARQLGDSVLYYTSARFPYEMKDGETAYLSRIMQSVIRSKRLREGVEIDGEINSQDIYNASASVSSDKKLMVFCHCTNADTGTALNCQLYESRLLDKMWNLPQKLNDKINLPGYTSTQPCIATNGADGYVLFFVSNRPGGKGKMDIWRSFRNTKGDYTSPENLSDSINTYDDEASPFFYSTENALYFSSKGKVNMGGFDIQRSAFIANNFTTSVNVGFPLNSSYDDLYFSINDNDTTGYLTSNRPGSMFLRGETCCYDIYQFKFTGVERKKWLVKEEKKIIATVDSVVYKTKIEELNFEFPLKLYFDNDYPDPRTTLTTTDKRYDALFTDYDKKQKEYEDKYGSIFKKNEQKEAVKDVIDFFDNDARRSFANLDSMCSFLDRKLATGKTIKIKVRGAASPLAASYYNFNLSERRIVSLLNYFDYYNNGSLKKYMNETHTFVIEKEPMGETESPPSLESKLNERIMGVYSPDAARQRYIEILSVAMD